MTAELVGPLQRAWFNGGPPRYFDLPKSTLDPRYEACADHRPACDCREALMAECLAEHIGEMKAVDRAMTDVLAGHPTYPPPELHAWNAHGAGSISYGQCLCTGCQIARLSRRRYFESRQELKVVRQAVELQRSGRYARTAPEDLITEVPF